MELRLRRGADRDAGPLAELYLRARRAATSSTCGIR